MIANLTNSLCRLCAVVTLWRLCCYRLKLCNGIPQGRLLSHANISFFSVFAVLSKLLQTNGKPQLALFRPKFLISTPYLFVNLSCSIQFHIIHTIFGLYDIYKYISTAWNISINTSNLSVMEVDTKNTIHKLISQVLLYSAT